MCRTFTYWLLLLFVFHSSGLTHTFAFELSSEVAPYTSDGSDPCLNEVPGLTESHETNGSEDSRPCHNGHPSCFGCGVFCCGTCIVSYSALPSVGESTSLHIPVSPNDYADFVASGPKRPPR